MDIPELKKKVPELMYIAGNERFESMGTSIIEVKSSPTNLHNNDNPITNLGACYPNPMSLSINVPFEMGEATQVNIAIYDILGQRVDILIDSWLMAGSFSIEWKGTNSRDIRVVAGVYFVKMVTQSRPLCRLSRFQNIIQPDK